VAQLSGKDLDGVLELSLEAHACESVEAFCRDVLPQLRRVVPGDSIGYYEIDLDQRTAYGATDPPGVGFEGIEDRLLRVIDQHPLAARQRAGDLRPWKISDFLSVRQYHGLELYRDLYRLLEYEDQLAFGLPGAVMVPIAINRSRRSFTDRDREVLELARPHLAQAYAKVIERERIGALVESLEAGMERRDAAIIQLDRFGRVAHLPAPARDLLEAYCGSAAAGARLPPPVAEWKQPDQSVHTISGPRGQLRIHRVDDGGTWPTLLLQEHRSSPPPVEALEQLGLTARQAQILRLLATGKGNDQIARELTISVHTVRKHLEHIYERLGVTSQAQAIARAMS
jgi:DNA-binding CsgD family transcriptional regulator